MILLHVAAALAALPFLPHGKGALILILGGLAILPASLLWSRLSSGTQWAVGIEPGAARLGLGPCRVVSVSRNSCLVRVARCPGCQRGVKGPCESERRSLLAAASTRAPNAKVVEVGCNISGACTFVVQRGRPA